VAFLSSQLQAASYEPCELFVKGRLGHVWSGWLLLTSHSLYAFSTAHAAPAISHNVFSPQMTTTLHRGSTRPTSLSSNMRCVCSNATPSGMPCSSASEPWIGPGHETASSTAGEIASSIAGWVDAGAGYGSGAVSSKAGSHVLQARRNVCSMSIPRNRSAGRAAPSGTSARLTGGTC